MEEKGRGEKGKGEKGKGEKGKEENYTVLILPSLSKGVVDRDGLNKQLAHFSRTRSAGLHAFLQRVIEVGFVKYAHRFRRRAAFRCHVLPQGGGCFG